MNLVQEYGSKASALSIGQYCPPRCFELAGKRFDFAIDTAEETGDAVLSFIDETTVEWSIRGDTTLKAEKYECRKSDDNTYLVSYCISGKTPRENHTWVIDKEQMLVTFLRCAVGENPYWPYLIDSHWGFGYINEDKEHIDRKRHGFSTDPVGTAVKWTYGHELATVHVYYDAHWYRIGYPKTAQPNPDSTSSFNESMRETMKALPGSDEPCYYVKIKEGMYLASATEQNMEKILGDKIGFRSDTLCFLDNWNHMYSVGRGFGTATRGGQDSEIFVMIGKYGAPEEVNAHFFSDPNPYLV